MSQLTELVLKHLEDFIPVAVFHDEEFRRELNIAVAAVCTVNAHGSLLHGATEEVFHAAVKALTEIHAP